MVLGRKIRNMVLIFVFSNLCMIGIVAATYLIPNTALRQNTEQSYNILQKEGFYPKFIDFDRIFFYDNYTDSLIINTVSLQPEENIFVATLENNVSKLGMEEGNPMEGIEELLEDETQYTPYLHYFCWIAPLLKVLFLFWNIGEIRLLLFSCGLLMAGAVLYKLNRVINMSAAAGLAVALVGGGCLTNIMCIAYSTDIILMYAGMLLVLIFYEKNRERLFFNERYVFFILGMLCFMLNYWSMPTITLCGPLTVLILLKIKDNRNTWYIKDIICDSVCWALGIGSEILFRFGTAYALSGQITALGNLENYIASKTVDNVSGGRLRLETVYYSVAKYFTRINKYIFCGMLLILLICLVKEIKSVNGSQRFRILVVLNFAMIATIPLVWIGVLYNHTYHGFDIFPICMSSFAFTSAFAAQLKMGEE